MKKLIALSAMALTLSACGPTKIESNTVVQEDQNARMQVVSSQYIKTTNGVGRDMLVVRDKKTGREYLVIQGFGAVEMVGGKHKHEE